MGTLRSCACLAALVLVACDSDGKKNVDAMIIIPDSPPDAPSIDAPPDGPSYDFSCLNNTAPTTADAMISIGGSVQEIVVMGTMPSIQPAANATIDICRGNCIGMMNLDTQGPTPADGSFMSVPLNTAGMPFNVYVQARKTGNRPTLVFPPAPLTTSFMGLPVLTFTNAAFGLIVQFLAPNHQMGNGNVLLAITDCSNMPIGDGANLMVTVQQNGTPVPNTDVVDVGTLEPQLAGTYFIFNVPPGTTEVGAVYNGMTLRAHNVRVDADTTTATIVRPGF
jgi:hypothetical protein